MRSLVLSMFLFSSAVSAALGQAFVGLSADPLLVWLYTSVAIIMGVFGIGFWFNVRKLDAQEEALNRLPDSDFHGRRPSIIEPESAQEVPNKS
jgi:proton-dependent oligopeptide transporter, POT family